MLNDDTKKILLLSIKQFRCDCKITVSNLLLLISYIHALHSYFCLPMSTSAIIQIVSSVIIRDSSVRTMTCYRMDEQN
jgi:hypothetical protein